MPLLQGQCACGGGCPRCKQELGIQTKLKISEPGDKYEQEADRIADEVMRMPEPSVQPHVEPEEAEEEIFQRKAQANPTAPLSQNHASLLLSSTFPELKSSPSQPLDAETQTFMESRFSQDFSKIRLHIDAQAAKSAESINARAYTIGRDIVFGAGQYTPTTPDGKRLLAHELTHVLQQGETIQVPKIQRSLLPQNANCGQRTTLPIHERASVEPGAHFTETFSRPASGRIRVTVSADADPDKFCHADNTFGVNVWQCHIVTDESLESQQSVKIGGKISYEINIPTKEWNTYEKFYVRVFTNCKVLLDVSVEAI
jgi:hypothetical protein